ncbi:MAG: flagellar motor protein [Bryobacterales bacterium]|nr:flagellar motor protein [Bryobacterales bacterium]
MATKASRGIRFDAATPLGVLLALGGVVGGLIAENGEIQDILQATAALIVLGGTLGAVLVTTPLPTFVSAMRRVSALVLVRTESAGELIEQLVAFATKARRQGIISLEQEADRVSNPFFRKAMNLAIDGTPLQDLRRQLELEISLKERRAEAAAKVFEAAGGYAPTVGIIGAVMGLIQVMKQLDNLEEVGHGIAVAFVATVYGVGIANLFLIPAANKLLARAAEESESQELILEGVCAIVEGLNPKLVRMKLEAYLEKPMDHSLESAARTGPRGRAA